jgi:hypothetical protein
MWRLGLAEAIERYNIDCTGYPMGGCPKRRRNDCTRNEDKLHVSDIGVARI